jgi:hypothetical protein
MSLTTWVVALISLSLPHEFTLVGNTSEKTQITHAPPGVITSEEFRSWQSHQGKQVCLFYWVPYPTRDGGPIVSVHEYPVVVAGQKTKIIEASQFMGQKQVVFVSYLQFKTPESSAMLYAKGLSLVPLSCTRLIRRSSITGHCCA